ncbi:hypothetical protein HY404_04270 [Candidatus Microgenomates bacterium]|nr:hypothetical protein [Candidatus Microgenomates bacterium]
MTDRTVVYHLADEAVEERARALLESSAVAIDLARRFDLADQTVHIAICEDCQKRISFKKQDLQVPVGSKGEWMNVGKLIIVMAMFLLSTFAALQVKNSWLQVATGLGGWILTFYVASLLRVYDPRWRYNRWR